MSEALESYCGDYGQYFPSGHSWGGNILSAHAANAFAVRGDYADGTYTQYVNGVVPTVDTATTYQVVGVAIELPANPTLMFRTIYAGRRAARSYSIMGMGACAHRDGYNVLYGDWSAKWYGDPQERIMWWDSTDYTAATVNPYVVMASALQCNGITGTSTGW